MLGGDRRVAEALNCVECGGELDAERAQLGYRYCTQATCHARHHRGVVVTAVAVNKSADILIVAEPDEIRRRGEAGEFTKKDSGVGVDFRDPSLAADAARSRSPGRAAQAGARPRAPRRAPAPPRWTREQENIVRLYHDMGLSPSQIARRASDNAPKLAINERLAVQILSAPRR